MYRTVYFYLNISKSFKSQYITILSDGSEDEDEERGAHNLAASPSENDAKQHTQVILLIFKLCIMQVNYISVLKFF